MSTTKISLQNKCEITANVYEEIRAEAVNAFHMAITEGQSALVAWLTPKTIDYDQTSEHANVKLFPCVCTINGTSICIGDMHNLESSYVEFTLDDDTKNTYLYLEFFQTYKPDPKYPQLILSTTKINDKDHALIAMFNASSKTWTAVRSFLKSLTSYYMLRSTYDKNSNGIVDNSEKLNGKDSSYFANTNLSNVNDHTVLNKVKNVDGSGSGLDADTVDGEDSSYFANTNLSNVNDHTVLNKVKNIDGIGSGLDADLLDGKDSSAFAPNGYGLGTQATRLAGGTDLNSVIKNGWYDVDNPKNGVSGLSWQSILVISSADINYVTQIAFPMVDGQENVAWIRQKRSSTWSGWVKIWTGDSNDYAKKDLSNVDNHTVLNKVKAVDGSGSGLDADTLDGTDGSYYADRFLSNVPDSLILHDIENVDGPGSGLDADMVDGINTQGIQKKNFTLFNGYYTPYTLVVTYDNTTYYIAANTRPAAEWCHSNCHSDCHADCGGLCH